MKPLVIDADAAEQACELGLALYRHRGGELWAETMAAADCGSSIARTGLLIARELQNMDRLGLTGRAEVM